MRRPTPRTMLGIATLFWLAACGSSGSTGPTSTALDNQVSIDLADNTAQAVVVDYADIVGGGNAGGYYQHVVPVPRIAPTSVSVRSVGTGCAESVGGDPRYYCPSDTVVVSGSSQTDTVIHTNNYEFFAGGTAQTSFTTTTDSISYGGANGIPIYFALHTSQSSAVSHRVRRYAATDKTPSFSADTVRTWNGTTTATDTGSYSASPYNVSYTGGATDKLIDVIYIHQAAVYPYPVSGKFQRTAHWNYSYTGASSGTGAVNRTVVVTFDGTKTPTMQVTGGVTFTCKVDLTNGNVSSCH